MQQPLARPVDRLGHEEMVPCPASGDWKRYSYTHANMHFTY